MTKFIGGVDFHELRSKRIKNYDTITLALGTAVIDKEFIFTGNYVYIAEATDIDVNLSIRFCEQSRAAIKMVHGRAVRTPFYRLYLSWAAQPGKSVVLAMGVGEENLFEILDIGKALSLSGTVPVDIVASYEPEPALKSIDGDCFGHAFRNQGAVGEVAVQIIWNPPASGVNLYLLTVGTATVSTDTTCNLFMAFFNAFTGLAEDSGALPSYWGSLVAGGAKGQGYLCYGTMTGAELGAAKVGADRMLYLPGNPTENKHALYAMPRAYVAPPGYGIGFYNNIQAAGNFLDIATQWTEKAE